MDIGVMHNLALLMLIASIYSQGADANVGVNYGTVANDLPPPSQVARFLLESTTINRVRLFDANPAILKAFERTGIAVTITVPNELIPQLARSGFARQWVETNVKPNVPATNIVRILVGNEVLSTANRMLVGSLVVAIRTLHAALVEESLDGRIQVSTPHSLGILAESTPPSAGRFREGYDIHVLKPLLSFHRATNSPFMVNPYPFFGCSASTLDYALFRPNAGVTDENTKLLYSNMLDGQLDAVYSAMKLLGFGDVEIVIAETGWPSLGDSSQVGVDAVTAAEYNSNLIRHVTSGTGTPLMPNRTFEAYIFALFNEDMKLGPTCERNFGLFHPDMTPVYDAGIMRPTAKSSIPTDPYPPPAKREPSPLVKGKRWCLPETGAKPDLLQRNIDYVCGLGYDCGPIKEGGPCFLPNTVQAHAAYAMNMYYQATGRNNYDCDFAGTASVTSIDPRDIYEAIQLYEDAIQVMKDLMEKMRTNLAESCDFSQI